VIGSQAIIAATAAHFHMLPAQLIAWDRRRAVVRPRQIAMFLCRTMTKLSLSEIGKRFADRDHTTVLHAVRSVEALIADDWYADHLTAIRDALRAQSHLAEGSLA
jgi:chromosomal replication initiation ATPase DnaA